MTRYLLGISIIRWTGLVINVLLIIGSLAAIITPFALGFEGLSICDGMDCDGIGGGVEGLIVMVIVVGVVGLIINIWMVIRIIRGRKTEEGSLELTQSGQQFSNNV